MFWKLIYTVPYHNGSITLSSEFSSETHPRKGEDIVFGKFQWQVYKVKWEWNTSCPGGGACVYCCLRFVTGPDGCNIEDEIRALEAMGLEKRA